MRKSTAISVVAAAALTATAAAAVPAAAGPRPARGPEGFSVEIVGVTGSGCPVGTVRADTLEGKDAFTVVYSELMAQAGGSSSPVDARKNCQVFLQVSVPKDVTYAISSSEYWGFAHLENGANATLSAGFYIQGHSSGGMVTHTVNGFYDDLWNYTHRSHQLVFKPCGEERTLYINTQLRVDKGTSDPSKVSFIAMDYTGEGPRTIYNLAWKSCP
ncbi:DUF4360 domain-containing protein [Actinomadura sp. 9N215]|uniref:DUF4360 domain-containing protein n=1 Tax=Actinomadura sp. 9N215 TaxID=3375150 RepID=UPI003788BA3E